MEKLVIVFSDAEKAVNLKLIPLFLKNKTFYDSIKSLLPNLTLTSPVAP